MEIMRTVDDSFAFLEKIGMRKCIEMPRAIYNYPSLPQKGKVEILGNVENYYYVNLDYHVLYEVTQEFCMDEPYVEFGLVEKSYNFLTRCEGENDSLPPPSGVTFMVVRPTGATSFIYCNRETYCLGSSFILRHDYCQKHLSTVINRVLGSDVDMYSVIQIAGDSCLPVWTELLSGLRSCKYTGNAAQLYLDGKANEVLAALTFAIENIEQRIVPHFTAYERKAVTEAQNILKKQIKQPPSIKKLSQELGMNPNKMQAVFKHFVGVTVMEYLRSYRMGKALELLSEDFMLEEIASEVGYKSASRFSEAFEKTYGILPSKYRKLKK